eukprot:gene20056-biopygen6483
MIGWACQLASFRAIAMAVHSKGGGTKPSRCEGGMLGGSGGVGKLYGAAPHTTSPHHHCHRASHLTSRVGVLFRCFRQYHDPQQGTGKHPLKLGTDIVESMKQQFIPIISPQSVLESVTFARTRSG